MPQQLTTETENNFIKGLVTEATGMNFPENACTQTENCVFSLIGDVTRRFGFDFEPNFKYNTVANSNAAINTYKWNNAGGDGESQIVVVQIGTTIYFYLSSAVTATTSTSSNLLSSTVDIATYVAQGGTFDATQECQFTDGNGYLFITHPSIDPAYCTFINGVIASNPITIQIRDFVGAVESGNPAVTARPLTLTSTHNYNLINQGWSSATAWNFTSTSRINNIIQPGGSMTFNDAPSGLPITPGTQIQVTGGIATPNGTMTFSMLCVAQTYSGTTLFCLISGFSQTGQFNGPFLSEIWYVQPAASANYISEWSQQVVNFPSNADVWWQFKNSSGVFNPAVTIANVTLSSPAPQGSLILNAFNQNFSAVSGVPGLGTTITTARPRTCAWFQGRTWYAGCDASENNAGPGANAFYTWTENIYFSQIITQGDSSSFGKCYQTNDPTSENLFDLLDTDGGVITIPGCGAIYKLFPIANGMIVFAANGVWFITGSQGIGFAATDYTVTKLSQVQSISGTSFVNVLGLPYFWNEEGIYAVTPSQGGQLSVEPITVGTILTFYNNIPQSSRKYARGTYDPINYIIQWCYLSTVETSVTNRYQFDSILTLNTYNKAFYPYSFVGTTPKICGIQYISSPGDSNAPDPIIQYLVQTPSNQFTFAEEFNEDYLDYFSFDGVGVNYTSFFVTGYKIRGQAIKRFQPQYIRVLSRTNAAESAYTFQVMWDYANQTNSNRWSTIQYVYLTDTRFDFLARRHKVRGNGYALQYKISSVQGQPFDIIGWSAIDTVNTGT
jgi:hypothetical protein